MSAEPLSSGRSTDNDAEAASRSSESKRVAAAGGLLALLSVPYLLSLASPLRLSWDAVVYLSLARELVTGEPYETNHTYPTGYPHLLALLDRAGLGIPWVFVAANLLFLAVGLLAAYLLFRRPFGFGRPTAILACCGILLAHDVARVSSIPLSDATFFGVSMLCLLLLERSADLKGLRVPISLVAAALLAAAAFEIRTVGVALWPAVLFAVVARPAIDQRLQRVARRRPVVAVVVGLGALLLVGGAAVAGVMRTSYVRFLDERGTSGGDIVEQARLELSALGELATNVVASSPRVPNALSSLLAVAGALLIAVVAVGVIRRRRVGALEVYGFVLALVLIAWPLDAPRLWIPALPILIGYAIIGARALAVRKVVRLALTTYVFVFAAIGAVVLGDSARLSLSGSDFADRWASETPLLHATYRVAFGRADPAAVGPAHPGALRVLRYYEPRASAISTSSDGRAGTRYRER